MFPYFFQQKVKKEKRRSSNTESIDRPIPDYVEPRLALWTKLQQQYAEEMAQKTRLPIYVTLADGKIVAGTSWQSSPFEIAKYISPNLAGESLVAKVNNQLWDLNRPLEGDCQLQLMSFDEPEGREAFWRSSALVLGEAMENIYGGLLSDGSANHKGYQCDMYHQGDGVNELF